MIFIGIVACCVFGWCMLVGVVLLWRFGLAVAWGVVFCEVCNRCGCGYEGGCCGITVEDGDDCGWWCVLKGVVYACVVWFVVGKM